MPHKSLSPQDKFKFGSFQLPGSFFFPNIFDPWLMEAKEG